MNATGGATRTLMGRVDSFAWSPDSKKLVYTNRPNHLGLVDLAGNRTEFDLGEIGYPYVTRGSWSPDGTQIAFTGRTGARFSKGGVYVIGVNGKGLRRLA